MEVGDAVDQCLAKQDVQWPDKMNHKRRASREQYSVSPPHRCECRPEQPHIRHCRPEEPFDKILFLIFRPVHANDAESALSYPLRYACVRFTAGQPDERDGPALSRPLVSEHEGVLTNCTKVRRQPVTDVYELLRQALGPPNASHGAYRCTTCMRSAAAGTDFGGNVSLALRAFRMT